MAIPGRYQTGNAGHQDFLLTGQLRGPLLDDYYGSLNQKADVLAIAEEIKRRYLAKVPRDSGNLASTAHVSAHRSKDNPDRRWEAEFEVGGPRAPYVLEIEADQHILNNVLREMGYRTGDMVSGPTGRLPTAKKVPKAPQGQSAEESEAVARRREAGDPAPHIMTVAERRAQLSAGARRAADFVESPSERADRMDAEKSASRSELDLDISAAADLLSRARPGTKSSEQKYRDLDFLNRAHYIQTRGTLSGTASNAMATHNLFREQRGLDRLPSTPTPDIFSEDDD